MKRSIRLWLGTLAMALIFGVMLTSCKQPTDDSAPTYTVLTRQGNASDEPSLQDGYYSTLVLTDEPVPKPPLGE